MSLHFLSERSFLTLLLRLNSFKLHVVLHISYPKVDKILQFDNTGSGTTITKRSMFSFCLCLLLWSRAHNAQFLIQRSRVRSWPRGSRFDVGDITLIVRIFRAFHCRVSHNHIVIWGCKFPHNVIIILRLALVVFPLRNCLRSSHFLSDPLRLLEAAEPSSSVSETETDKSFVLCGKYVCPTEIVFFPSS